MSSRFRKRNRSAGFSLGEVLVALAIAAMMAAMLTRFVGGTRLNAARIGEALEMSTLGETLLARVGSGTSLGSGRTDGRSGDFRWRIEIEPLPFSAVARRVNEKSSSASEKGDADGARTKFAASSMKLDVAEKSGPKSVVAPHSNWITYRIVVAVEGPTGRKHVADTVRIGPPAAQR